MRATTVLDASGGRAYSGGTVLAKIFVLFTVVTLAETYLLYVVGAALGGWWTLALILLSAALGAFLTKREGLKIWRAWKDSMMRGELPEEGLTSGILVLIGAALLVTPGVLTDVTGMLLLIPPTRRFAAKHVAAYVEKKLQAGIESKVAYTSRVRVRHADGSVSERVETRFGGDPNVIDAEGEVVEERRTREAEPKRARLED